MKCEDPGWLFIFLAHFSLMEVLHSADELITVIQYFKIFSSALIVHGFFCILYSKYTALHEKCSLSGIFSGLYSD